MVLASIASILSSPIVHGPIIFFVCRIIAWFRFYSKIFNTISYLALIWVITCSMTYPSVLLIKYLEDQYPVIPIESEKWRSTDAIVVLACNHFEDDELPFVSRWPNCSLQRNIHAWLMYKEHPLPIFLAGDVLGVNDEYPQAIHNQSFFENMGVKNTDIFITLKGRNTETEVGALASILDGKEISLVTSSSHLPRAVRYFEEHNIKVVPIPVEHLSRKNVQPVVGLPNAASLYRSERAIHEYFGLVYLHFFR